MSRDGRFAEYVLPAREVGRSKCASCTMPASLRAVWIEPHRPTMAQDGTFPVTSACEKATGERFTCARQACRDEARRELQRAAPRR